MLVELPYIPGMDYSEGMDARMQLYAENPGLSPMRAEDVHFACMYVLLTAQRAMEGEGAVAKLQKANVIFDRLTRDPMDRLPDLGEPGLSYDDLDDLCTTCQGWYEVFEEIIATIEAGVDGATLRDALAHEVEYHNYKQENEPAEDRRCFAELVSVDFG